MKSDCIVIGAGYSGLAAASLLAKQGFSCTLLEKHTAIGGCASFFRRMKFSFDVGATTLSGVQKHQPLGKLFDSLQISPELKQLDPAMIIYLDDKKIIRYQDKKQWIQEAESHFGKKGQAAFWNEIYAIDNAIWELMDKNPEFPPSNIKDVFSIACRLSNIKALPLLVQLFRPMDILLEKHGLHRNALFKRFINEQLLISTQSFSDSAPIVTGAMGLAYPSETYYPIGGIVKPAQLMLDSFRKHNGTLIMKEEIVKIKNTSSGEYAVYTAKGNEYICTYLISSIPIWNLSEITSDSSIHPKAQSYAESFPKAWGAFTVYFAVESDFMPQSVYNQVHTKSTIPHCEGDSFFMTYSMSDDIKKAPQGWHTITISTHTEASQWFDIPQDIYEQKKQETLTFIMNEVHRIFPELEHAPKEYIEAGTPVTFAHYTGRHRGFVGGIPHSVETGFLGLPRNNDGLQNFYHIGDTAFPGQGTPAVIMSAMNAVQKIIKHNHTVI